jgi:hypothetical protein
VTLDANKSQGKIGVRSFPAGSGEERALGRSRTAALLRDLEPALHSLGALEQRFDLVELLG